MSERIGRFNILATKELLVHLQKEKFGARRYCRGWRADNAHEIGRSGPSVRGKA
ncbi:hypothetical protein PAMC26510_27705 [Caballeronia sordidicola]|uniref:Uncharacterized protein n=1 Tax=Caballeronia sordidicola TaxID=196367 RepID=A0A242ME17_CABSO|nr:hypothetical protein PAMC26510_27705 [Caballeronia sordidicola]